MESGKFKVFIAGFGCAGLLALTALAVVFALPLMSFSAFRSAVTSNPEEVAQAVTVTPIETELAPVPVGAPLVENETAPSQHNFLASNLLTELYDEANPGVVSIFVNVSFGGQTQTGAGSGFIYDEQGYIITNNHVVADADMVIVVFYDGTQVAAEIIGTDDDSDLAVIKVDNMPESVHPLPLGDSDQVDVGDWVVAIGNPFGLNSSMTIGITSAIGRTIASGATPFSIPHAIQTDAAINPGNSGGPLLNLAGQVIGVNAQIASGGSQANAGVGFAIPSSIVRKITPSLVEFGAYQWPWLGIRGTSLDLFLMQANDLDSQAGTFVFEVIPGSPAEEAGLEGASGTQTVSGIEVPAGGDVIIAVDGETIDDYSDLQVQVSEHNPGDTIELTVIRNGEEVQLDLELAPRPESMNP